MAFEVAILAAGLGTRLGLLGLVDDAQGRGGSFVCVNSVSAADKAALRSRLAECDDQDDLDRANSSGAGA